MIRTVLGEIAPTELQYCHAHEHLWIAGSIDDYELSLKELRLFAEAGGKSLVDAQPVNAGGSVEMLKRLSGESGVHIISSNGFYLDTYYSQHSIPAIKSEKDTGIMKCALDIPDKMDNYKRAFEETIDLAKDGGLPVMVHVERNADVIRFLDYLDTRNMDLRRVILCHMDKVMDDLSVHGEAFEAGCYLEYDAIGRYKYHDDEKECSIIRDGIRRGYEEQILLSLDTTRQRLISYGGTPGLGFIRNKFESIMLENGITKENIHNFMINNPRKAFNIE